MKSKIYLNNFYKFNINYGFILCEFNIEYLNQLIQILNEEKTIFFNYFNSKKEKYFYLLIIYSNDNDKL